jgi:SAM-dependent methyltransferase
VRSELQKAGFRKELVIANAKTLRKIVGRLEWNGSSAAWSGYGTTNTYGESDTELKASFVRAAAEQLRPGLVWDLGCNDGRFADVAAEHAQAVIAVDGDHAVIDTLARRLHAAGNTVILPLVGDLADPSPARGWRGAERRAFDDRGAPDLTLALALVHHLAITRNVPLTELLDSFVTAGGSLVVEWVEPSDPQAQRLLAPKRAGLHGDYNRAEWERLLFERFDIERTQELNDGLRVLYLAHPRQ